MSTPSPQRQGVLCPKLGGPVFQAVSDFAEQEFYLQNRIAPASSTVHNTQQRPTKRLLNWNVTSTFSYYTDSQAVACVQFAKLNKGNLVKVQILIQSIQFGDPRCCVLNKLAGDAAAADPGPHFE